VPDLRLKVLGSTGIMTPAEYGTVTASGTVTEQETRDYGIVGAEVVFYPQDDDQKLTMRQILDELLAPFPGTVVRANASGNLEIVPSYGPDASNTAAVTLTNKDCYTVSQGQPNPEGVINRCTVTSQPYVWTEDAGGYNDSWFQIASGGFPEAKLFNAGAIGGAVDLTGTAIAWGNWSISDWQPVSSRFIDTSQGVKLSTSGGIKQVTVDYRTECESASAGTATDTMDTVTLTDLPCDGGWHTIIEASDSINLGLSVISITIEGRYDKDEKVVNLRVKNAGLLRVDQAFSGCSQNPFDNTEHTIRVNLADASDAWQSDSKTVTGEFGFDTTEDWLQAPAGATSGNARDATIDVTGYGLTDGTVLKRMAEAYVLDAMNPTLVRTVEQSVWRAFPVKFSDMGKIVALPGGEEGRVISRSYVDDFGSNFGDGTIASSIKVEVVDQDGDGYIDVDTNFLRLDNGDLFQLDNDEIAEVN